MLIFSGFEYLWAQRSELLFVEELKDSARLQLQRILAEHELEPWIFTDIVQIVHGEDAHSKPILTLNANHLDAMKCSWLFSYTRMLIGI